MNVREFPIEQVSLQVTGESNGKKNIKHSGLNYNTAKDTFNICIGENKYLPLKGDFLKNNVGVEITQASRAQRSSVTQVETRDISEESVAMKLSGSAGNAKFYRANSVIFNTKDNTLELYVGKDHVLKLSEAEVARETGIKLDPFSRNMGMSR